MQLQPVSINRIIWERCFDAEECVKIPFDGRKCLGIHACVRIIEEGGVFFAELQVFGSRIRYALANVCYPVYSVGVASLEVCTTNINAPNGNLESLDITVKGCVGGNVGPVNIQKCWSLLNQTIHFFNLTTSRTSIDGEPIIAGYNDWAYAEE
jgi:hypothetical protein